MGGINTPEHQKISHLMKGKKSRKSTPTDVTRINDGPSDLESIIGEVPSNLTPLTREKLAPSPYRTKRTGESSWGTRPRPRQKK
ncbi:UNVERIFIED_CONTAM: hypothetical protein NCL1_48758 [Trichonephila clavipes]